MTENNTAIQTILNTPIVYSVTDEALKTLEEKWVKIPSCDDKENYEIVRIGISEIVKLRTSVEKRRKELKSDSLEYGRRVDSAAKIIKDRLVAIETPLKASKAKIDDAKRIEKERKAKIEQDRIDAIQSKIQLIKNQGNVKWGETSEEINDRCAAVERQRIDENDFQEFFNDALEVKKAVVNTLIEARDVAQEKEKKDAAERVRQQLVQAEQEKEAARLKKEQAEIDEQRRKIEEEKRQQLEKEAEQKNAAIQKERFDEIVRAIDGHEGPIAITEAIINNEIPYVKYTG